MDRDSSADAGEPTPFGIVLAALVSGLLLLMVGGFAASVVHVDGLTLGCGGQGCLRGPGRATEVLAFLAVPLGLAAVIATAARSRWRAGGWLLGTFVGWGTVIALLTVAVVVADRAS